MSAAGGLRGAAGSDASGRRRAAPPFLYGDLRQVSAGPAR
jgi:hypothetical protein